MIDNNRVMQIKNVLLGWCEEILNSKCDKKNATEYPTINVSSILNKIIINIDEFIKAPDIISLVEEYEKNAKWIRPQKVMGLMTVLNAEISFEEYEPKEVERIREEQQVLKERLLELVFRKDNDFIVDVVAGMANTTVLRGNGTIEVFGIGSHIDHCWEKWTDIVSISKGFTHTVGLKKDGTVVSTSDCFTGSHYYGSYVEKWTDIVSISAGYNYTVGLKKDGTVVAYGDWMRCTAGQCNVQNWTDVVSISAGENHTVGLKKDGTVVAVGNNNHGQCNLLQRWRDIVSVSAGVDYTVGLKKDGTVVAVGANYYGQCNVQNWTDVVSISAGFHHTVGLKKDGTVVAVGENDCGQCNVQNWRDVASVSAGFHHTVGLKKDGTVVAVGENDCDQCNVDKWKE